MSLRHLPTIRIVSGSARANRSATPSPPCLEGARANFLGVETNRQSRLTDDGTYGDRDIVATNLDPLVFVAHGCDSSCASDAVASNI